MAKISPISAKYIIQANIEIDGVVDKPDVIGAIFGQTEGLLGEDLELRELQRSGRIGRIEVNAEIKGGKTRGVIIIPSSLDKSETAIVAAALEVIQRIGPCNAKIKVDSIEDVRISKRHFIIERAKELLKNLIEATAADSQEITDEVASAVRVMEIQEYGRDRLPAGPSIDESEDIIIVEGRADVLNLLKYGFKNAIAVNGTSVPETLKELCKHKETTVFVDGDRGGDLIIRELLAVTEIDYVTKAPDGKEVEELTKKEIHKALRSRISAEQIKLEMPVELKEEIRDNGFKKEFQKNYNKQTIQKKTILNRPRISDNEKKKFMEMLNDLVGTKAAYIVDQKLELLGKVPLSELNATIKELNDGSVYAVIFDGIINEEIIKMAESSGIKFLVAMNSSVKDERSRIGIITIDDF